jgi:hypothetical protein
MMNLTSASSPARYFGAAAFIVLVVAIGAGRALADPPTRAHDYFAQVAAGMRPDDRAGIRGVDSPLLASASGATTAARPDDRAGIHGIGTPEATASAVTVGGASRFDWNDAGIGAGSMLGIVLVGGALVLLRSRLRAPASHA